MHRMVSARGAGHNVVAQPSLLHFAQLFQFALLSHAHQIDNDPDARIDYDTSYLRPSSSQSELILVQRHKLTMGKENDISAHFSRFPREARVTTMRVSQRNKTADQPLAVCRMTGPMGAWSMQLSGCFNPDGLTSPRPIPDPYPGPPPSASPSSSPPLHRRRPLDVKLKKITITACLLAH